MNATTVATINRDELYAAIREANENADRKGQNWHFVRVSLDGGVIVGEEVGPCYPADEYQRRRPHPVTVWSVTASGSPGPGDGVYEWEPCGPTEAEFFADADNRRWCWPADRAENPDCTEPMKLGGYLDAVDFTDDYNRAERAVAECDWFQIED